jgi:ATP-dependent helicase/nuclease subunit B
MSSLNALIDQLHLDAIVVTPTTHLSNQLRAFEQLHNQETLCFSYLELCEWLFNQAQIRNPSKKFPKILNGHQEYYLWKKIIANSGLTFSCSVIKQLRETWTICHEWGVDIDDPIFLEKEHTLQFQAWYAEFALTLEKLDAITPAQLAEYLIGVLDFSLSKRILWVNFDSFTLQQMNLQKKLIALGCSNTAFEESQPRPKGFLFSAKDEEEELAQIIAWSKQRLAENDSHIGIIIPNLKQKVRKINRTFSQSFAPHEFSLALESPLISFTLIYHATQLLSMSELLDLSTVQTLFSTPYIRGAEAEFIKRCTLYQNHRGLQEAFVSSKSLRSICAENQLILSDILANLPTLPAIEKTDAWVEIFFSYLQALGFPGDVPLDPDLAQQYSAFKNVLLHFKSLSLIEPKMTLEKAIENLREMLSNTGFQLAGNPAKITILDWPGAVSSIFNSLWVSGATTQNLSVKFGSTLIPYHLLKEKQLPFYEPSYTITLTTKQFERLKNYANISVFSYPQLINDIPELPLPNFLSLETYTPLCKPISVSGPRIKKEENFLVPFVKDEVMAGGTYVLAHQGQCPFRAFAVHRLHASSGNMQYAGLNPIERGQLIHKIMENIWRTLKSQEQLLQLSESALEDFIHHQVTTLIKSQPERYSFSSLISELEIARMINLVHGCLAWEKERPPFTVLGVEESYELQLGDVHFSIRVDRIDEVAGKKWIIDYKSSLPGQKPWYEQRPEEPQLLMYALLDDSISALLFLQIKTAAIACHGLSEEKIELAGVTMLKKEFNWESQKHYWRENLIHLADEFSNGYCEPKPNREEICQRCEFGDLCRKDL